MAYFSQRNINRHIIKDNEENKETKIRSMRIK